jgi:hypothetical protein
MQTCPIYIGRLVSHPCGRKTSRACPACRRPVCERHLAAADDARCVQCAGAYTPPPAPIRVGDEEMFAFTADELAVFDGDLHPPTSVGQVDDS